MFMSVKVESSNLSDVVPCCVDPDVRKARDAFASKVKGSRTSEEPCFYIECLTL
jgi:hypothetical protein